MQSVGVQLKFFLSLARVAMHKHLRHGGIILTGLQNLHLVLYIAICGGAVEVLSLWLEWQCINIWDTVQTSTLFFSSHKVDFKGGEGLYFKTSWSLHQLERSIFCGGILLTGLQNLDAPVLCMPETKVPGRMLWLFQRGVFGCCPCVSGMVSGLCHGIFLMLPFLFLLSRGVNWEGGWEWMIEMGHFSTFLPLCLNCPPPAMQSLQEKFLKTIKTNSADSANEGNEEAPVLLFLPNISALVRNFPLCLPCGPANAPQSVFLQKTR